MATFRCHQSESPLFSKKGFQWYYSRSIFLCITFFRMVRCTLFNNRHFRCGRSLSMWQSCTKSLRLISPSFLLNLSRWFKMRCPNEKNHVRLNAFPGSEVLRQHILRNKFEIANSKIAERMLVWLVWLCTFTYIINSYINHNFMPFLLDQREFFQLS